MEQPTGQAAIEYWQAQPVLEPGTEGFWPVWGANPASIRKGDILMSKSALVEDKDTELTVDYVAEVKGIVMGRVQYVDQHGKSVSVGMLCHCAVVRWGTKNTLDPRF